MKDRLSLSALAFLLMLGIAVPVAGQTGSSPSSTDRSTPGVPPGTTGTSYGTPGVGAFQSTPGGTVPMGAGTQDQLNLPSSPRNYNNSPGPDSSRRSR